MMLILPDGVDTERIASAIDAENVESWCDESNRVHIAVDPWYSTKDVDQTVLSATKVIHVLLGLHANDADRSMSLGQKFKVSLAEILSLQKKG